MKNLLKNRKMCIRFAVINGILVLLMILISGIMGWISGRIPSLRTAEIWRGENRMQFTQIACFLPFTDTKTQEDIWQFRRTLEGKLTDASITAEEGTSLYQDAWSAPGKVTVSGSHGRTDAGTLGVGGNFFLFHPLQLLDGSYITEHDLMQDRVILDEELAWILFGSSHVSGMEIEINGAPFYVAGVIRRESDFATGEAYRDGPGLYMSYSAMNALTPQGINSYEIVLPNMITGFGLKLVQENFSVGTGAVMENSGRLDAENLLKVAGDYGRRSMGESGVAYPYWENGIRMTEDYLAALLILAMILGVVPGASLIGMILFGLIYLGKWCGKKIPQFTETALEKHREKRFQEKYNHRPGDDA